MVATALRLWRKKKKIVSKVRRMIMIAMSGVPWIVNYLHLCSLLVQV